MMMSSSVLLSIARSSPSLSLPIQKAKVVLYLKEQGEVVGMLADGINDCVALRDADAGISVDTGVNAVKDCADIIPTKKERSRPSLIVYALGASS